MLAVPPTSLPTNAPTDPPATPDPTTRPAPLARVRAWIRSPAFRTKRWLQTPLLLTIASALLYDRYTLCQQYLFKYTDEDQGIMWYAAHELLNGRLHEPCFFGQDYNSCIEGYLAAPLIAVRVPYHIAVPLITVILGLLPFLLLAFIAWRRGNTLAAAGALLVPLLLPSRYGLITGMPRGFVTGIAFAMLPTLLLLPVRWRQFPPAPVDDSPYPTAPPPPRHPRRSWPKTRYFLAGVVGVIAIQLNPNCLVLLVPVAIFAILTTWREWRFWLFGTAGLLAAAPIFYYVHQFYYVTHDDYRVYLRDKLFTWSYANYSNFLWRYVAPPNGNSLVLGDLVPLHITPERAPLFTVAAFAAVALLLIVRLRPAALLALIAGVAFTLLTFAYDRVADLRGMNTVSFSVTRMYLAIPVLFAWSLLLLAHKPWRRFHNTPMTHWLTRGLLAGFVIAALIAVQEKSAALPDLIKYELRTATVCRPVAVEQVYAFAKEVQRVADESKATLLVLGGQERYSNYILPTLTSVETLYPMMERRTWRLIEETQPKLHTTILLGNINGGTPVGGGTLTLDSQGNIIPTPPPRGLARLFTPAQPQGRGAGGRGGNAGGRGGPSQSGGGGGGGRGGGFASTPATLNPDGSKTITLPTLSTLRTNGRSAYDTLRALGVSLPRIITPDPTPENPTPDPKVERFRWNR